MASFCTKPSGTGVEGDEEKIGLGYRMEGQVSQMELSLSTEHWKGFFHSSVFLTGVVPSSLSLPLI